MIALKVLALVGGAAVVLWVLWSAVRSVVVPRGEQVWLNRKLFLIVREIFEFSGRRTRSYEAYDRVMARYGPAALVSLPVGWSTIVVLAFVPMYWAVGAGTWRTCFITSGSSFATLGFNRPEGVPAEVMCFIEAFCGVGLVALLISYLPAIYAAFSRREAEVVKLDVRAGTPPTVLAFLRRYWRIGQLDSLDDEWGGWEQWFVELEESHTSQAALPFFRSQHSRDSSITAAGAVMDTAAVALSSLDSRHSPQSQLTIRAGFLALRAIADFFHLPYDPDPAPDDPISIRREEFEELLDALEEEGLPVKADRDQAWRDYAGWRVNYDEPLLRLCALVSAPVTPWSSDRIDFLGPARQVRLGLRRRERRAGRVPPMEG